MPSPAIKRVLVGNYCSEAQAVFNTYTSPVSPQRKLLLDRAIRKLKGCGVWDKYDACWVLAHEQSQPSRVNIKNPGTNTLSVVASPTFAADQGWTAPTPATDYLNTGIDLTSGTWKFVQDSAHMAIWSRTNLANAAARSYDMGVQSAACRQYISRSAATSTRTVISTNINGSLAEAANGYYPGHVMWSRTASNAWAAYGQGVGIESGADASAALQSATMRILAATGVGGGANQIALAHLGSNFTATDAANDFLIWNEYMKAIGAA